jgi:biopolymer transport protein TolQ
MENEAAVEAVQATDLAGSVAVAAHDMSFIGLFMQADIVVKLVMLMLIVASVWCWAIIFDKIMRYKRTIADNARFQDALWSSDDLDSFYKRVEAREPDNPAARIFISGMQEWYRSRQTITKGDPSLKDSLKARISDIMGVTLNRELDSLENKLGFLATVGSASPFIGLFGTVWGIMNSFQSIAVAKNTSLAVVAPGIAEALLATAIGLAAAIPAVIFYNKFMAQIKRIDSQLDDFSTEFGALISRQLDGAKG